MLKSFPYRYRVHALLFFLMLITYLDRVCISLVGVRIKSAFKLNNVQFGWALGAFAFAYALFEIPTGILGDRIGQRASFIRIVLWWSIFTALTGLTMGLITLVITRFIFGMGEAGAFPNSTGAISRWFPKSETCRAISFLFAGVSAGAGLAPLIIIPLASAFGWRTPFFVIGVIGLVWVIVCYRWFKNNPSEMKQISSEERSLIENNRRFTNHHQPLQWKKLFKIKTIWAMVISFFCSQWALYFFVAWMPVYLQEGRHFTETQMKFTTSFLFTVGIISALLTGLLGDLLVMKKGLRFTRRIIGTLALCIVGVLFFLTAQTTNNSIVVVCLVTAYFFLWPFSVTSFSTCVDISGDSAGTIAGVMNFSGQVGALFLALIFGKIVDSTHNFNAPLYVVTAVLITGGITWLIVDPEIKIEITETQVELSSTSKIHNGQL